MAEALFLTFQVIGVLFLIFLWSYYLPEIFCNFLVKQRNDKDGWVTLAYRYTLQNRRKIWTYSWLAFIVIYIACHVYLKYFNI